MEADFGGGFYMEVDYGGGFQYGVGFLHDGGKCSEKQNLLFCVFVLQQGEV